MTPPSLAVCVVAKVGLNSLGGREIRKTKIS